MLEDLKEMKEQQCFLSSESLKKQILNSYKILQQLFKFFLLHIIMEMQKISNLLGSADNESLKFATRKWYVINDQINRDYGDGDENGATI